jgi:hypothetical protein
MKKLVIALFCLLGLAVSVSAQYLNKTVSIHLIRKPVSDVLDALSKQGGFIFSYNSDLVPKDSLVSVQASNKTVRNVLDQLFDGAFEYREKKNYIIIQPLSEWEVTGYVLDRATGEKLRDVSVYETHRLVASLTNDEGFFRLKLRDAQAPQYLTVRKMSYVDTSIVVRPGERKELVISISSRDYTLDSIVVRKHNSVEDTWFGKMFLSSKEKIQSMNLAGFFVDKPYQVSLIPGLGTHGRMSSQVENNVSFNILGGYTAGVSGVELGGLFNLVKKDVEGVQVGGLFNTAGGKVNGVQVAGLYNQALDSVKGVQAAGLANVTRAGIEGLQLAGLYNQSAQSVSKGQIAGLMNYSGGATSGVQIAGLANFTKKRMKGTQLGGVANITLEQLDGVQISGVFNYTRKLKGVQIGLINYADSSSGISLGLINIVPKGYHKLSVYHTELIQLSAALKSGTRRLYTIWLGGFNPGDERKVATFGYGVGTELSIASWLSLNPELTAQHLYLGDWDHLNLLSKATLQISLKPLKYLELFVGPSYNIWYTEQATLHEGFLQVNPKDLNAGKLGDDTWNWLGWTVGLSVF